jgi:hypothetical protein
MKNLIKNPEQSIGRLTERSKLIGGIGYGG